MRHDDVDGGAVELESHGGGGGTAVASYASFGRTTIIRTRKKDDIDGA